MESIATDYKKVILLTLVRELEFITIHENTLSFMVRDVNSPKNCETVCKYYEFLKKHFHLPRTTRQPQKIVSQTMLAMFKACDMDFKKSTRCYYVDALKTTSGHYETCI